MRISDWSSDVCSSDLGQEGVEGDDLHAQAQRAFGDDAADIATADQAERLLRQLDAHEAVLFPLAGLRRGVGFGNLARQREHHRDRMFGGDRKSTRLNSSHYCASRMPSSA